jgi:hypothetical protein
MKSQKIYHVYCRKILYATEVSKCSMENAEREDKILKW